MCFCAMYIVHLRTDYFPKPFWILDTGTLILSTYITLSFSYASTDAFTFQILLERPVQTEWRQNQFFNDGV